MIRRSKGFKRMIWICLSCGARNPGPEATCTSCGVPQPPNVEFILPDEADFITEEEEIARARLGPDLICPYCGARNRADNESCHQCTAPLDEAARRKAGAIARKEAPATALTCPSCGAGNPTTATSCFQCGAPLGAQAQAGGQASPPGKKPGRARKVLPVLLLVLLACSGLFYALFLRPARVVTAQVSEVYWQTTVAVEEMQAVRYTDQTNSPPSEAYNVSSRTETTRVCEETTVDRGNGYAEVIEECYDEAQTYYSYTLDEWVTVDTYSLEGRTLQPEYAQPPIQAGQRLGRQDVRFQVTFSAEGESWTYTPNSLAEFQRYRPGSRWQLQLNALGGIVSVSSP